MEHVNFGKEEICWYILGAKGYKYMMVGNDGAVCTIDGKVYAISVDDIILAFIGNDFDKYLKEVA